MWFQPQPRSGRQSAPGHFSDAVPSRPKTSFKMQEGGARQLPRTPFPSPAVFPSLSLPCEPEEARGRGGERGRVPAPSAKAAAGWMPGPEHAPNSPQSPLLLHPAAKGSPEGKPSPVPGLDNRGWKLNALLSTQAGPAASKTGVKEGEERRRSPFWGTPMDFAHDERRRSARARAKEGSKLRQDP